MKNLVIAFSLYALCTGVSFSQWNNQNIGLDWLNPRWLSIVDQNTVFFCGDCGGFCVKVFRTTDGGSNWSEMYNNSPSDIQSKGGGRFFSATLGYAAFDDKIMKTTDGGASWSELYNNPNPAHPASLRSFYMINQTNGFAFYWDSWNATYIVAKTTDEVNWNTVYQNASFEWKDYGKAHFLNSNIGYIPGFWGKLYKTVSGGNSWTTLTLPQEISGVFAVDENVVYAYSDTIVFRSTNGGSNWTGTYPHNNISNWINGIYFFDADTGWITSLNGTIYKTTDKGNNWGTQGVTPPTSYLRFIGFANAGTGWAIGKQGTVLKTTNGGGTIVDVQETEIIPARFSVLQNYPNPFNPSTIIEFVLPHTSFVTLKIFNLLGQEVATILKQELSSGKHQVEWNASSFQSGIYFYRLQANSFTETKKIVLLR